MPQMIVFDLYNTLVHINRPQYVFRSLFKESVYVHTNYSFKTFQKEIMTQDLNVFFDQCPAEVEALYHTKVAQLESELASITLINNPLLR